jgi:preprotein translocase subunit SecD
MQILNRGRLTIIHINVTVVVLLVLCTITGCNQLKKDFTGGTECILQVETDQAVRRMTFEDRDRLMNLLKESEIAFSTASLKDERTIEITGLGTQDETKVKEILDNNFREWDYQITGENAALSLKNDVVNQVKEQAILQALEVMKKRLSALGLNKEYIERKTPASDRLKLRIPPIKDPERIMAVIRMGGILEFRHVISGPFAAKEEALNTFSGTLPKDLDILQTNPRGMEPGYYVVKAYPVITGRDLENARRSKDNYGSPNIAFTLTSAGAAKFRNYTSKNIGQKLAIVLDNKVQSAPVIQDVLSKEAVITGRFTIEEAEDMARILNSGALPAPVKILEEKIIEKKEK